VFLFLSFLIFLIDKQWQTCFASWRLLRDRLAELVADWSESSSHLLRVFLSSLLISFCMLLTISAQTFGKFGTFLYMVLIGYLNEM